MSSRPGFEDRSRGSKAELSGRFRCDLSASSSLRSRKRLDRMHSTDSTVGGSTSRIAVDVGLRQRKKVGGGPKRKAVRAGWSGLNLVETLYRCGRLKEPGGRRARQELIAGLPRMNAGGKSKEGCRLEVVRLARTSHLLR